MNSESEESQWRMRLTFLAEKAGLTDSITGVGQLNSKTEELIESTKRLTEAEKQELQILTARNRTIAESRIAGSGGLATAPPDLNIDEKKAAERRAGLATEAAMQREAAALALQQEQVMASVAAQNVEAVEKVTFSFKGMGTAISQVGRQLGGIAGLGRAFMNPIAVAVIAAIGVFIKFKEEIKEVNAELDKIGDEARNADFSNAMKAREESLVNASVAAAKYYDKVAHLRDPEEVYQRVVRESINLIHERAAAEQKVADATGKYAETHLEHQQSLDEEALTRRLQSGAISQAQYNQMKLKLDAEYFAKLTALETEHELAKLNREKQAHADEIKSASDALEHRIAGQKTKEQEEFAARQKAADQAGSVAGAKGNLTEFEQKKKQAEDEIAKIEARFRDKATSFGFLMGDPEELARERNKRGGAPEDAMDLQKLEVAQNTLKVTAQAIIDLRNSLPGREISASLAEQEAARKASYSESGKSGIEEAKFELDALKKKYKISDDASTTASNEETDRKREEARQKLDKFNVGGGYTGGDIENAAALQRKQQEFFQGKGQNITPDQQAFLQSFEQYVGQHGGFGERQLAAMAKLAGNQTSQQTKLEALEVLIEQLTHRVKDNQHP